MKKVLVTGISGFAGSHLVPQLVDSGNYSVSGTYLSEESLNNLSNPDSLDLHKVDLLDESATRILVEDIKPEIIFHLAALTSPKNSFDNPSETFVNNIKAQINVFEAVKKTSPTSRILVVSSAEVYGLVSSENLPIDEDTPYFPTNPYAVSKLAQDYLGLQYYLSAKLDIVRVRPFNHIGPRQAPFFVVPAFAKRIVDIEKGKEDSMKVGNLSSRRDFTDVTDMMKAYILAVEKGVSGEVYNLGSGKSHEISEILEMMIKMSTKDIKIEQDPALMMPSDNPDLVCDYSKFEKLTGWKPEVPIEKTLKDTLDYWRNLL